jgi:hypothetical protein
VSVCPPRRIVTGAVTALVATVLAGIGLTGCSGSSTHPVSTPAPSISVPGLINSSAPVPPAFLARAEATCNAQLVKLRARGPVPAGPADPNKLTTQQLRNAAPFLAKGATIEQAAAATLAKAPPPAAGADQWRVFVASVGLYAAGVRAEADVARTGTPKAFLGVARRLLDLRRRVLASGNSVGLGAGTACSRLF